MRILPGTSDMRWDPPVTLGGRQRPGSLTASMRVNDGPTARHLRPHALCPSLCAGVSAAQEMTAPGCQPVCASEDLPKGGLRLVFGARVREARPRSDGP